MIGKLIGSGLCIGGGLFRRKLVETLDAINQTDERILFTVYCSKNNFIKMYAIDNIGDHVLDVTFPV